MNGVEFSKIYENNYHFFFSELNITETNIAMLVELMRASQHINDIHKMMIILQPSEKLSEEAEAEYWGNNDSLVTFVLSTSASQLREALKVFGVFSETDYFKTIIQGISTKDKQELEELLKYTNEFKEGKGFLVETLKPMRDIIFHYDFEKVIPWIKVVKSQEKERKPNYQSINLDNFEYGPGLEYSANIYSKYLFWGTKGFDSFMVAQKKVWELQSLLLISTQIIVKAFLKNENISKRKYGWFAEFVHGYKPKS